MLEVLVGGFEDTKVYDVFGGAPCVFAEEYAVLVFDEEPAGEAGSAAELLDHGAELGIDVRKAVEQLTEPAEVGVDENCLGMLGKEAMLSERGKSG